jgi:urease accessory protein
MTTDTTTPHGVPPRAVVHRRAGEWPEELAAGSLTLEFDDRHRRRTRLVTDEGDEVLLDLPTAIAMGDRDGLQLNDGTWLVVRAAAEPVVDVAHLDPGSLVRLAWHLGNRHVPTEIGRQGLRIRPDHVIEEMLRGFGATLVALESAFQPEGGAYGGHRHGAQGEASDHHEEP